MVMNSAMTKEDRDRYHWFQNAQNLFWQSPIWEVQTRFDEQFNETLLDEIYGIGKDIVLGKDKDPKNSIWDYSRPNLDILKQEIIDIVTKKIVQNIPQLRMLNIRGCEHFMGWVNVREPGEKLEVHGHTESAIAATYYIKAKEGCGDLVLFDSSHAIDWLNISLSGTPQLKERRYKPVEGRLIFFPSYVLHGVEENKSDDLRISLSTDLRKVVDKNAQNTVILKSWGGRMAKIKEWK
jgi:Putative 2OG-Fe(II) oxygenase